MLIERGCANASPGALRVLRAPLPRDLRCRFGPGCALPGLMKSSQGGLTLIELLAVIGIIAVLAGITFGIARGVQVRAGISKTRIEIAGVAQALEAYKVRYGDYPQTSSADTMLQCLIGRRGPTGATLGDKALIEMARFTTVKGLDPFASTSAVLMDPFGKAYNYAYKTGSSWRNPSFVFYSGGPDGVVAGTFPADGFIDETFETAFISGAGNPDNIYHGRD